MSIPTRVLRFPFLRTILLTALCGHWAANLVFDRDEYAGAPNRVLAHLFDPILAQTAIVVAVVIILTLLRRLQLIYERGAPTVRAT